MKWAGQAAPMEEIRNECNILVGKPNAKSPLASPRLRLVDTMKVNVMLQIEYIHMAQY